MDGVRRLVGGGERLGRAADFADRDRPDLPPGSYIIVAVRLDEKSSGRATASVTAAQLLTA